MRWLVERRRVVLLLEHCQQYQRASGRPVGGGPRAKFVIRKVSFEECRVEAEVMAVSSASRPGRLDAFGGVVGDVGRAAPNRPRV